MIAHHPRHEWCYRCRGREEPSRLDAELFAKPKQSHETQDKASGGLGQQRGVDMRCQVKITQQGPTGGIEGGVPHTRVLGKKFCVQRTTCRSMGARVCAVKLALRTGEYPRWVLSPYPDSFGGTGAPPARRSSATYRTRNKPHCCAPAESRGRHVGLRRRRTVSETSTTTAPLESKKEKKKRQEKKTRTSRQREADD